MLLKIFKQLFKHRLCLAKLLDHFLYRMPISSPLQRKPNVSLIAFHRSLKTIHKTINGVHMIHNKSPTLSSIKLLQPSLRLPLSSLLKRNTKRHHCRKSNGSMCGNNYSSDYSYRYSRDATNRAANCGVSEETDSVTAFPTVELNLVLKIGEAIA